MESVHGPQETLTLTSLHSGEDSASTSHIQDEESGVLLRIERVFPIRVNGFTSREAVQRRQKSAAYTAASRLMPRNP